MSLNRLRHEIIFESAKKINRLEIGRLMFYNRLVLVAKRGKGGSVFIIRVAILSGAIWFLMIGTAA